MRLAVLLLASSAAAWGHTAITTPITYTKEISRLIGKRCLSCHQADKSVPLATYEDARAWAVAIREQVQTRAMPPWDAARGFGHFRDNRSLTQPEIDLFVQWVEGGTPQGDPAFLPHFHAAKPAATPAFGGGFYVRYERRVRVPMPLAAIRAEEAPEGASIQVTALLPDGRVEPLLWIPSFRKRWNRVYVFREPIILPPKSSIQVHGPPGTLISGWLVPEPRKKP